LTTWGSVEPTTSQRRCRGSVSGTAGLRTFLDRRPAVSLGVSPGDEAGSPRPSPTSRPASPDASRSRGGPFRNHRRVVAQTSFPQLRGHPWKPRAALWPPIVRHPPAHPQRRLGEPLGRVREPIGGQVRPGDPKVFDGVAGLPAGFGLQPSAGRCNSGDFFASLGSSAPPRGSTAGRSSYGIPTPMRFSTKQRRLSTACFRAQNLCRAIVYLRQLLFQHLPHHPP